ALALEGRLASLFRNSTASDAYLALGKAHGYAGEWEASDADIRRAIRLAKNNSQAQQTLGRHFILRGRAADGIKQLVTARIVDSTSATIAIWLAYAFFLEGNRDSTFTESDRAIQVDSTLSAVANLGALLNLALGKNDVALRLAAKAV